MVRKLELHVRLIFALNRDISNFLSPECKRKGISHHSYFNRWVNLRWLFAEHFQTRRVGVVGMLEKLGLKFEGREHSGIDDSRNIARIAIALASNNAVLRLNDGLAADHSVNWRPPVRKSGKPQPSGVYSLNEGAKSKKDRKAEQKAEYERRKAAAGKASTTASSSSANASSKPAAAATAGSQRPTSNPFSLLAED